MQMYDETGGATAQCRACNVGWVCGHFFLCYCYKSLVHDIETICHHR